jgi:hypothetical protein
MSNSDPNNAASEHRVLSFRTGRPVQPPPEEPVEDLAKYAHGEGRDEYRHRMIVNVVALLFVAGLIGAGIWIADTMASMRKNQDCVLSGRSGCTPVEYKKDRW